MSSRMCSCLNASKVADPSSASRISPSVITWPSCLERSSRTVSLSVSVTRSSTWPTVTVPPISLSRILPIMSEIVTKGR